MNISLLTRIEDARWQGLNSLEVKIIDLDALVAEVIQLRQEKIQIVRDHEYNDDEKLIGFVKPEAILDMRQGKARCCRMLRFKKTPYFVIPVYLKPKNLRSL